MRCIKCGNHRAGRARRRTAWDWILSGFGVYPYRCGACETRFHSRVRETAADLREARAEATETPVAVTPERKPVRRRRRKGLLHRLKELTDIRREKRIRIATQLAIYGFALLTFMALVYALTQFGLL